MRQLIKSFIPPIVFNAYRRIFPAKAADGVSWKLEDQNEGKYWGDLSGLLETWGEDHVWNEIQMFLFDKKGKVLDIACGTGAAMVMLKEYKDLEVYGLDNSADLIAKCKEKGFDDKHLILQDALAKVPYEDNYFDYSYSIGLLHYIKENELDFFIDENYRTTKHISFHKLPMSLSDKDEDIVKTWQNYINNSSAWWAKKFERKFKKVICIKSGWKDNRYGLSKGVWLVCIK